MSSYKHGLVVYLRRMIPTRKHIVCWQWWIVLLFNIMILPFFIIRIPITLLLRELSSFEEPNKIDPY